MNFTHRNNSNTSRCVTTAVLALSFCAAGVHSALGQTPSTDPMRTIIPVRFDAGNGDITIGSTTYKGASGALHLVALRRLPNRSHLDAPDVVVDMNSGVSQTVRDALSNIQTSYPDAMILVNTAGAPFRVWEIGYMLVPFGASTEVGAIDRVPLAFVGNVGRAQGTAQLQRVNSTRPVNGFLAPDSNGNYAFIQTEFVRYDITMDGTIKIGSKTYKVADAPYKVGCDAAASNSLHLVVVDRESPDTLLANNAYCNEFGLMAVDLGGVVSEGVLVFIASNGRPIPANWNFGTNGDSRVYSLAQQVRRLGGYWETMVYLSPNDTYSLVGAVAPPTGAKGAFKRAREASSVYPEVRQGQRPTGELHGVLARSGRGNWYSPLNADPSGDANLGFYEILGLDSAPFPHPAGTAEVAAFQYINGKLCNNCNIRDLYDDTNVSFSNYLTQLQAMTDSSGRSCDVSGSGADPNFCTVRTQLMKEFTYVNNIRLFYSNLTTLWQSSGTLTLTSQLQAFNDVQAQVNPPPTAQSQSLALPIVHAFLGLAEAIPEVGEIFGLADVILNFATELTTDEKGNEKIDLTSTIANLLAQANDQFIDQGSTTGTLFQMVYQDWAKLDALGRALADAKNAASPWYWSSSATATMLRAMLPIIQQASYQNVMAAAYAIGWYVPNSNPTWNDGYGWGIYPLWAQPRAYAVEVNRPSGSIPFSHPFWQPEYVPFTYPGDPGNGWANDTRTGTAMTEGAWLGISALNTPWQGTTDDFKYRPPSYDLLSKLFTPSWNKGLGVYRPAFFNSWPFPRVQCSPAMGNQPGGGYSTGGCDWDTAAPAPENLASGRHLLPSLTIRAKTSPQPTRQPMIDVMLMIHNDGTTHADSITIDSITLRTLAGSGQATLISPALPIRLSNLQPGRHTVVAVKLNVPPGVTRLSLTTQGTHTSGNARQPTVHRFTEAQALVLQ